MIRLVAAGLAALALSGCVVVHREGPARADASAEAPRETAARASATDGAASARNPIDLRRTTLLVRDIERSLAFYRDALGLEAYYDQEITSPDGLSVSRLVLLRANDPNVGVLGLWELEDADQAPPPDFPETGFETGDIVLLFNTPELDRIFPLAAQSPGVTVLTAPRLREYPGDGVTYRVMVSVLRDPDGHAVELNNRLSPPLTFD